MKKTVTIIALILMSSQIFSQAPTKSESVLVNGKQMHYEVYGKGSPLFLLHGYSLSSKSWLPYVSDFDKEYEVYLIDLTGHGKSTPFKEDLSIRAVADDLNSLIQHLKLERIKAIGFSFGGDVLYQLALLNPTLLESMITIGAVGTWDVNDFPQFLEGYIFENRENFSWLATSHASDDHIRAIMSQFKNYTVYLSNEELQQILPETLILMGDDDEGIDFNEVARAKKNLPNSDIWILPNVAHGAHEGENKEEFVLKAKRFLNKNTKRAK